MFVLVYGLAALAATTVWVAAQRPDRYCLWCLVPGILPGSEVTPSEKGVTSDPINSFSFLNVR